MSKFQSDSKSPSVKKKKSQDATPKVVVQSMEEQLNELLKTASNSQTIDWTPGESIVMLLTAALHSLDKPKLNEILKKKQSTGFIRKTVRELPNDLVLTLYEQIDERLQKETDTRISEILADWLNCLFIEKFDFLLSVPANLTQRFAPLYSYIDSRRKNRDALCVLSARLQLLNDVVQNRQPRPITAKEHIFEPIEHQKPKKVIDISDKKANLVKSIDIEESGDEEMIDAPANWWTDDEDDDNHQKRVKRTTAASDSESESLSSIESLSRIAVVNDEDKQGAENQDESSDDADADAMLRQEDDEMVDEEEESDDE